jgi:uncharacterized membrane-anchored protein
LGFGVIRTVSLFIICLVETLVIWMDEKGYRIDIYSLDILLINFVVASLADLFDRWLRG